ncbi:MAG: anthranilate phosphoribosyltransferase [Ruaniaceae bacterium]|nr:anthranilate phosphoribosyltransferase [Ruaniaceae bacterium]
MTFSWPELTSRVISGSDLTSAETAWAMDQVMGGGTSPVVLAGFLTALATKGESVEELAGLADSMLAHAQTVDAPRDSLDIVGTGGDRARTVNISTMAAIAIAGAGVTVVKHGNRASSSASGSADLLEALGVDLTLDRDAVGRAATDVGITFLFANLFHPSMRYAAPTRRELGIATSFNLLGPLTNPARPRASAVGVSSARHAPLVAGVFAGRGASALVFRGQTGLDELTTVAPNDVWEVRDGAITHQVIDATNFNIPRATLDDLRGADPAYNAEVAQRVFDGEEGIIFDTVMLNAAAGLVAAADDAEGSLAERLSAACERVSDSVRAGDARRVLERWIDFNRENAAS